MRTLLLAVAFALGLTACSGGGAGELLATAQLEEQQRNVPHARKLYQQIVDRYPESSEAAQAQARLAALGPAPAAD